MWGASRVLAVVAVITFFASIAADAAPKWCEDDPVIQVNGKIAHVTIGFSDDNIPHLDGKITYYVVVAQSYLTNTTIDATMATLPTETYIYALSDDVMQTWKGDKIKVIVFAHVPSKKTFATVTTVSDFSQTVLEARHGKSNTWIEVDFNLL
jgi:hypothetical protein